MARPPGLNIPKAKASSGLGSLPGLGASTPPPIVGRGPGRPKTPGVKGLGSPTPAVGKPDKVGATMKEFAAGNLHSGSKTGPQVTKPQAGHRHRPEPATQGQSR